MSKYIEIPAAALLSTLTTICEKVSKAGGQCSKGKSGREVTFDITPPNTPVFLRVFTSLGAGDSSVRGCGEDAVRLVIGFNGDKKFRPLAKSRRIYRTAPKGSHEERVQAFLDRLTQALREGYKSAATHQKCFKCGKPMQLRTNKKKGNQFWGCIGYPECRSTLNKN